MSVRLNFLVIAASCAAVSACGGAKVKLSDPTIPEPLIDQLPISVAASYPENFSHFVHEELVIGKEKWTIDLGRSNALLFDQLFSSMFTEYQVIDKDADPADLQIDAFIELNVDAFEFSVPAQSQTEDFAVWIRYRIKIFDTDGNQIANWPISAYGKAQAKLFGNDDALRRAAVLAMRDAAALIILQMDKATGISKLSAAARGDGKPPLSPQGPLTIPDKDALQTTAKEDSNDDSG